jgi:hypothetical protein
LAHAWQAIHLNHFVALPFDKFTETPGRTSLPLPQTHHRPARFLQSDEIDLAAMWDSSFKKLQVK